MSTSSNNLMVAFGAALVAIVLTVASSVAFLDSTSVARVVVDAPQAIHLAAGN
ncbi:MAG: hypothetical protein KF790_02055 [Steroidobacteraceae bacterium]|nr:hypothetical protein [Steroidobacteraceae bacterium]MCW5573319.1 hypothetical protein [Steroidobacteraceae bacterium]